MGSSDTGTSTGVGDCTVGSIVWVRRRNGSWWPGKILGEEELLGSHVLSPRSGTPVKLLGREDASVDWYNMEKSKRVKAFRCGEFDDCIDKAECSQGMPPKKREKYARREDAIIHALELEKLFLEKQYGKLGSLSNNKSSKSSDAVKKELATSAESLRHGNGKCVDPKHYQNSGEPDLPHKGITSPHLQTQEVKEGKQLNEDDEKSAVLPRMRGLQDLGLKSASSKRKIPLVDSNGPSKSPSYGSSRAPLNGSGTSTDNAGDAKAFSAKRKKSTEGLAKDTIVKRRDKCRPLVQVLESSAMLPVPPSLKPEDSIVSPYAKGEEQTGVQGSTKKSKFVNQTKSNDPTDDYEIRSKELEGSPFKLEDDYNPPANISQDNISGSTEDTETDSSETHESDTDERMAGLSDESIEFRPKSIVKSEAQEEDGSLCTKELDDPASTSETSHPSTEDVLASLGVSKWQQKRKRNTRALTKRYVGISGEKVSRELNQGTKLKGKGNYGTNKMDLSNKKYGTRGGYGSRGLDGIGHNIPSWGDSLEYDDPVSAGRCLGDRRKCTLVDVELKVQSNYQREHVPMISLMSKINGQAIVGYPIQIEALEYGSTQVLLAAADDELNQDSDKSLPTLWRTARRTAKCRVPRPSSSSMMDGDEGAENLQHVHRGRKAPTKISNGGNHSHKTSLASKRSARGSRPTNGKKLLKKPAKKSVAYNRKTRTLASIAKQQKPDHLKHGSSNDPVNGPVKPESDPSTVACVPIKLVFSRLHEALGGGHQ